MIRAKLELLPYGIGAPERIGEIYICNLKGDEKVANYRVEIFVSNEDGTLRDNNKVVLMNFDKSRGALALLYEALKVHFDSTDSLKN